MHIELHAKNDQEQSRESCNKRHCCISLNRTCSSIIPQAIQGPMRHLPKDWDTPPAPRCCQAKKEPGKAGPPAADFIGALLRCAPACGSKEGIVSLLSRHLPFSSQSSPRDRAGLLPAVPLRGTGIGSGERCGIPAFAKGAKDGAPTVEISTWDGDVTHVFISTGLDISLLTCDI